MTKLRDPLSFHDAVVRVAAKIGWENAALAVHRSERTVRNWSDPDTEALPTIEDAFRLDAAYMAAGGGEAPILAVFAARVDRSPSSDACTKALGVVVARATREVGEAVTAMVTAATDPHATPHAKDEAVREIQEAIDALRAAQQKLATGPP